MKYFTYVLSSDYELKVFIDLCNHCDAIIVSVFQTRYNEINELTVIYRNTTDLGALLKEF